MKKLLPKYSMPYNRIETVSFAILNRCIIQETSADATILLGIVKCTF